MTDDSIDAVRAYLASKSEREQRRLIASPHIETKKDNRIRPLKSNRRWQAWEIELLGKIPDGEACQRTGRTLSALSTKRVELKIPAIRTRRIAWTPEQIAFLGKLTDREAAKRIGCTYKNVNRKRLELGIPYWAQEINYWMPEEDRLLGTMPDEELARRLNRNRQSIVTRRSKLGIPQAANSKVRRWTEKEIALLGKYPDKEVARRLGRTRQSIEMKRLKLRIFMPKAGQRTAIRGQPVRPGPVISTAKRLPQFPRESLISPPHPGEASTVKVEAEGVRAERP